MVLILLIVNLIGYILDYDQANRYIGILIDQKRYDQVEIQPHNSAIESHINNEGNGYIMFWIIGTILVAFGIYEIVSAIVDLQKKKKNKDH